MKSTLLAVSLAVALVTPAVLAEAGEPAAAAGGDVPAECIALLAAHDTDGPTQVLSVDSDLDEAVELRLERGELAGAPDGVYVERQTRLDAEGKVIDESLEVQSCGPDGLRTNSVTTPGTGGKVVYKAPRTWVPLPIAEGKTWTWTGETDYADGEGRGLTAETTVEGKVVGKETVKVAAGEFEAWHLEVKVTEKIAPPELGSVETYVSTFESWITVEPHYLLIKRRVEFMGSEVALELKSVER